MSPTDLAVLAADPTSLDVYDDPGEQIVLACQRANAWLKAGIDVRIETIVETKAQAAAVAAFAIQKQLGKDAELAALEVQRRAERGVGLAIRAGQKRGDIRTREDTLVPGGPAGCRTLPTTSVPSPHEVAGAKNRSDLSETYYPVTDDVTDDDFNQAIEQAKAEKNLSRANVIRKVKGEDPKPNGDRHELLRKTRRPDSHRLVEQTVLDYAHAELPEGLMAQVDFASFDADNLGDWVQSLSESEKALRRLLKRLREEQARV